MSLRAVLDCAEALLLEDAREYDRAILQGSIARGMGGKELKEIMSNSREGELMDALNPVAPEEQEAFNALEQYLRG